LPSIPKQILKDIEKVNTSVCNGDQNDDDCDDEDCDDCDDEDCDDEDDCDSDDDD